MSVVPESQKWGRGKKNKQKRFVSCFIISAEWRRLTRERHRNNLLPLAHFPSPSLLFSPPPPSLPAISSLRLVRIDLWWCEIALVHIVFLYIFIIGAINLMKGLMSACRWCAARIQMNFVCKEKRKFSHNFIKLQLCVCERESVCISISTHMWMLWQTQLFFFPVCNVHRFTVGFQASTGMFWGTTTTSRSLTRPNGLCDGSFYFTLWTCWRLLLSGVATNATIRW